MSSVVSTVSIMLSECRKTLYPEKGVDQRNSQMCGACQLLELMHRRDVKNTLTIFSFISCPKLQVLQKWVSFLQKNILESYNLYPRTELNKYPCSGDASCDATSAVYLTTFPTPSASTDTHFSIENEHLTIQAIVIQQRNESHFYGSSSFTTPQHH